MALLEVLSSPLKKALAVNANTSAFATRIPTTTEPSGDGVLNVAQSGALVQRSILMIPYGLGAATNVFSLRLIGWRSVGAENPPGSKLWVPTTLLEITCTLGTAVGVAGSPVLATEQFAHSIGYVFEGYTVADAVGGTKRGVVRYYSPADNTVAHVIAPINGCQRLEFQFDQTTGTPTMNVLVAFGHLGD